MWALKSLALESKKIIFVCVIFFPEQKWLEQAQKVHLLSRQVVLAPCCDSRSCHWEFGTLTPPEAETTAVQEFQNQMKQLMNKYQGQDEKLWEKEPNITGKTSQWFPTSASACDFAAHCCPDAEEALRCLTNRSLMPTPPSVVFLPSGLMGPAKLLETVILSKKVDQGTEHWVQKWPSSCDPPLWVTACRLYFDLLQVLWPRSAAFKDVALSWLSYWRETLQTIWASRKLKKKVKRFPQSQFTNSDTSSS